MTRSPVHQHLALIVHSSSSPAADPRILKPEWHRGGLLRTCQLRIGEEERRWGSLMTDVHGLWQELLWRQGSGGKAADADLDLSL